jgi:hypothetical protein
MMTLRQRRLPAAVSAMLLAGTACVCAALDAGAPIVTIWTSTGTIDSIGSRPGTLALRDAQGAISSFQIDSGSALVFQGIRERRIDDLRPGMTIEVDYLRNAGGELPRITWVEILPDENKKQ